MVKNSFWYQAECEELKQQNKHLKAWVIIFGILAIGQAVLTTLYFLGGLHG